MSAGETKAQTIGQNVKRSSNKRNPIMPPYIIAGFTGDRSGSMGDIDRAAAQGLYNWLEETCENAVKNSQQGKIFVTTFDNNPEKMIEGESIADVHKKIVNNDIDSDFCFDYMKARGSTRLYDTAIDDLDRIVQARDSLFESLPAKIRNLNPDIAMVWACCTDGFDNQSFSTRKQMREKILWARQKGVKCFFLAANQEAQIIGQEYGFDPDTSLTFGADVEHVDIAMRSVTQCMREASSGNDNYVFTQMMRQSSGPASFTPSCSPSSPSYFQTAMLRQPAVSPPDFNLMPTVSATPVNSSAAASAVFAPDNNITPNFIAQIGRS